LLGQYVNMGIHLAGSLGTTTKLNSTYFPKIFGLLADYDRNGFATSSPGFSGDYMVYGNLLVEGTIVMLGYVLRKYCMPLIRIPHLLTGWLARYTTGTNTNTALTNEGLCKLVSVTPYKFAVTSSTHQQSAIWIGRSGPLEFRQTFQLDNTGLFFTTAVSIKNMDANPLKNVYCKFTTLVSVYIPAIYTLFVNITIQSCAPSIQTKST